MRTMVTLLLMLASVGAAQSQGRETVTRKVLQSIALIVAPHPDGTISVGSGFSFWSTPTKTYFLTNYHVVVDVGSANANVLVKPNFSELKDKTFSGNLLVAPTSPLAMQARGLVCEKPLCSDPSGTENDLAVVVIDIGNIPTLSFIDELDTPVGRDIGVAGYPSFKVTRDMRTTNPSVHFGTINSYYDPVGLGLGGMIEFDALTDHGNSGGPLFEASTGLVRGVVTLAVPSVSSRAVQNNLAIAPFDILHSFFILVQIPHNVCTTRSNLSATNCSTVTYTGG
jgi:S1-C subfamily serine protease